MSDTLSAEEIQKITGGYCRPAEQLRELRKLGFYRARIGKVSHEVILERPHYEEICRGGRDAANERPKLMKYVQR